MTLTELTGNSLRPLSLEVVCYLKHPQIPYCHQGRHGKPTAFDLRLRPSQRLPFDSPLRLRAHLNLPLSILRPSRLTISLRRLSTN